MGLLILGLNFSPEPVGIGRSTGELATWRLQPPFPNGHSLNRSRHGRSGRLSSKGVTANRIWFFPNWVDGAAFEASCSALPQVRFLSLQRAEPPPLASWWKAPPCGRQRALDARDREAVLTRFERQLIQL